MITFSKDCTQFMWVIADSVLKDGAPSGLALWRQRMNPKRGCAQGCLFGASMTTESCAHCLEGRLRTLNLYRQTPLNTDCIYLRAADVLKDWTGATDKVSPAAA
ncbi:hypothetical protein V5T82_06095 [Magnetovibrio sp. PR-2]|uniref:hypothetical protein n=1 Tax=Magnetovibrio sp. PR-2 TaxID=3120356 RepID=UPI002FCDF52A